MIARPILAAFLFASGGLAQTFIVDASNGPGTNFTDLQVAVHSVPDDAVLIVRPGFYLTLIIDGRSLTVFADPGVNTVLQEVRNITANQRVVLRGVTGSVSALVVDRCAGLVVLDGGIDIRNNPTTATGGLLQAQACAQLMIRDARWSFGGIELTNCKAVIEDCHLFGGRTVFQQPGITIRGGSVQLSRCRVRGGDLVPGTPAQSGGPAILMQGGELRILDDGTGSLTAGSGTVTPPTIDGTGAVRLDPLLPVPTIAPGINLTRLSMPSLSTTGAALGGTTTAALSGPPGECAAILFGMRGTGFTIAGIDDPFWLDPAALAWVAFGVLQPGQPITTQLQVPNQPLLVATRVGWQAVVCDPSAAAQASNPSLFAIRP